MRTSLVTDEATVSWLDRSGGSRSAQVREDLAVLAALRRTWRRRLEITDPEMDLLRDLLNGSVMPVEMASRINTLLAMEIEDGEPDGLAEKWGVDIHGLAEKIRAAHPADAWAVWDEIREWWRQEGQ